VKLKDIRQGLVRGAKKSNLVAFNERKIHRFGYELGDRALPTACRAGDDPDVVWLVSGWIRRCEVPLGIVFEDEVARGM
jgi:hypothetical protein